MKAHMPFAVLPLLVLTLITLRSQAQTTYEPYTFTTLAGGGGFSRSETPGSALSFIFGCTVDPV